MKTLNEIQDEWSIDCKVNELNLGQESTRIPELHSKYLNQLTTIRLTDKVEYINTCLTQCDYIMKSINSRSFDIKNAIEWTKFTNGII